MKINFFWLGEKLNLLSILGLKSFIDHGHQVVLWCYEKPKNIIDDIIVADANEILERNKIFLYKGMGDCRKGACGGFSDLFRYYLLYKKGGWYCDTDVTCLKNFKSLDDKEYIFRPHNRVLSVANIIKCPAESPFLKDCILETEKQINSENNSWIKPLVIFSDQLIKHGLQHYVVTQDYFGIDDEKYLFNLIDYQYYNGKFKMPEYAIHWCNEALSSGIWNYSLKRDMNHPIPTTLYYKLVKKHKLTLDNI